MRTRRRYALHMKPGQGPTIEGLVIKGLRRGDFVLINAEILEDLDRTQELDHEITVLRENVYCLQRLQ